MKNKLLSVLALSAILALGGCNKAGSYSTSAAVDPNIKFDATAINLNSRSISLMIGEQFQIETVITPLVAYNADLVYSSSDHTVATVSADGLIEAIGEGSCDIKVSASNDEDVYQTMKVYVTTRLTGTTVITAPTVLKNYQKKNVKTAKRLRTREVEKRSWFIDGKLDHYSNSYENIIMDTDNGFFYVGGLDVSTRVLDGAESRSTFGYYIFTNQDYDSHIYHHTDNAKNRCELATQFYLGTDVSRSEVVYKILDSLFTIGRDIALDTFEDEMGTDWFGYITMGRGGGTVNNDPTVAMNYDYQQTIQPTESDPNLSTPTMEQNLDIPCYIPYSESDEFRVHWEKGVVKYYRAHFQLIYDYNGRHHVIDIDRRYTFERDDEFEVEYPNKNEYTKVDGIFDL
jgi:hypothetical protein